MDSYTVGDWSPLFGFVEFISVLLFQVVLKRARHGYGFSVLGSSPVRVSSVKPGKRRITTYSLYHSLKCSTIDSKSLM
jgi:hypothetical protein